MYKNKIVCALKHNNKPLSENKDTVFLPFNTTYSLYLKNMADTMAFIKIFINGRDISPNKYITLKENSSCDIEKFQDTNHTFIFKEKTLELQSVRENQDEDGLIRIEVSFQVKTNPICPSPMFPNPYDLIKYPNPYEPICKPHPFKKSNFDPYILDNTKINGSGIFTNHSSFGAAAGHTEISFEKKSSNSGITAVGKISDKEESSYFSSGLLREIEHQFSFILKLEEKEDIHLDKNIKKTCPSCDKKFKYSYFYCPFDGTFLD